MTSISRVLGVHNSNKLSSETPGRGRFSTEGYKSRDEMREDREEKRKDLSDSDFSKILANKILSHKPTQPQ